MRILKRKFLWCCKAALLLATEMASAADMQVQQQRIPDEYESVGEHRLGMGNSGMASPAGTASLKLNPAMIAVQPTYTVNGSYHWPTAGREFFQAGILDSKTSNTAAALSYTGYNQDYLSQNNLSRVGNDSPISRRASLGLAQNLKAFSLGIAGHYVEGLNLQSENVELKKSWTLGVGIASSVTQRITIGLSAENLANSNSAELAPRVLRAGLAYQWIDDHVLLHLDYVHRERVLNFEDEIVIIDGISLSRSQIEGEENRKLEPEQMVIGSGSAKIYDLLRILAAYGTSIDGDRKLVSGGLSVTNQNFSLSYGASRPDLRSSKSHQAVSLAFAISL